MASEIVQFRLPLEDLQFLRGKGIHPNEAARESLQGLIRSLRFKELAAEMRRDPFPTYFDPVKAIRETREDH